jgi:hypothetical protein
MKVTQTDAFELLGPIALRRRSWSLEPIRCGNARTSVACGWLLVDESRLPTLVLYGGPRKSGKTRRHHERIRDAQVQGTTERARMRPTNDRRLYGDRSTISTLSAAPLVRLLSLLNAQNLPLRFRPTPVVWTRSAEGPDLGRRGHLTIVRGASVATAPAFAIQVRSVTELMSDFFDLPGSFLRSNCKEVGGTLKRTKTRITYG